MNEPDLRRIGTHPDYWYPLGRSKQLGRGKTMAVRFAGEPIVLARSESGKVFALEDRCAHRQVPLSMGVVSGEQIKCRYHAWCYHPDGRLARVPRLPRAAKPPRRVSSYACREAYGHVFVFGGDPDKAREVPFPELPFSDSGDHKAMYFSRDVACHSSFMHENLLDMNHQFLHQGIVGKITPTLLGYEQTDKSIEAQYMFEDDGAEKHRGAWYLRGTRHRGAAASGRDVITIRTEYPYQTLMLVRPGATTPSFQLWAIYVPVDAEQRRHRTFGALSIRKPRIPGLIHLMWPFIRHFTESIFAEDRVAVEAEQRAWDSQGGDWNNEVFPLILDLRKLLVRNGVPLGEGATQARVRVRAN